MNFEVNCEKLQNINETSLSEIHRILSVKVMNFV